MRITKAFTRTFLRVNHMSGLRPAVAGIENQQDAAPDTAPPSAIASPPPSPTLAPSEPPLQELLSLDPASATDDRIQDILNRHIAHEIKKSSLGQSHTILVLHADHSITRATANRIYDSLREVDADKPMLLILNSPGGDIAAAYLIAKLCREHTKLAFEIAVPRRAKSAATLICCAADRIHMGSLSELGPIDPQFGRIPALALKYSVEHMAQLANQYPSASSMFSEYLAKVLRVEAIGYFERVAESAVQYAVRLLGARQVKPTGRDDDTTARRLVYSYKDHGFVIDAREAGEIFGASIVATNTSQYELASLLFSGLDLATWLCGRRHNREFSYVGGIKQGGMVWEKESA
jgi:hypothetical protein